MKTIKAVVGVLHNKDQQILIAKRQSHQFMGGFWELPGGKIEHGESPEVAISRELNEELGTIVGKLSLHQTMVYQYTDRIVELSIYNIDNYLNTPKGAEGQEIAWVSVENLNSYKLLPTMKSFINSITLPKQYWITPSSNHQSDQWIKKFEEKLKQGIKLIQLRSKTKLDITFIEELHNKCKHNNINLLLIRLINHFMRHIATAGISPPGKCSN